MRKRKNTIVICNADKTLLHIYNDLKNYGKMDFPYNGKKEKEQWKHISSKIGKHRDDLEDGMLIGPATNRYQGIGVVQTGKNIVIEDIKKGNFTEFQFKFKEQRIF